MNITDFWRWNSWKRTSEKKKKKIVDEVKELRHISDAKHEEINRLRCWSSEKLENWYQEKFLPIARYNAKHGLYAISLCDTTAGEPYKDTSQLIEFLISKGYQEKSPKLAALAVVSWEKQ